MNYSIKNIANAMYVFSKEAKEIRDNIQSGKLRPQEEAVAQLFYYKKDYLLDFIIKKTKAKPLGYHEFENKKRDYYEIEGFRFHTDECTTQKYLGEITSKISAGNVTMMTLREALDIYNSLIK